MLWRLQRNGRTSYLYGTLHVGRPGWARPGPQVAAALASSQVLALEIDVEDPSLPQQMRALAQADDTPGGQAPPALVRRLAAAATRACVPLPQLASLPPLVQATTIALADARWLGLDAAYGQERALAMRARDHGKPVRSLETLAEQMAAMTLAPGRAGFDQLDQTLAQLEDGSARAVLYKLAEGWDRGDLALLSSYESWCNCAPTVAERQFLRQLNDDRNPRLAQRIEALHAQGQTVFAAVGALHMTGPQALPGLLAARGFLVHRLVFREARANPPRTRPN